MRVSHDSEGQRRGPRSAEGKGLDRGFSPRQNLTPNRTARLVILGGSRVTPGATSIMVNPKRKKNELDEAGPNTYTMAHSSHLVEHVALFVACWYSRIKLS